MPAVRERASDVTTRTTRLQNSYLFSVSLIATFPSVQTADAVPGAWRRVSRARSDPLIRREARSRTRREAAADPDARPAPIAVGTPLSRPKRPPVPRAVRAAVMDLLAGRSTSEPTQTNDADRRERPAAVPRITSFTPLPPSRTLPTATRRARTVPTRALPGRADRTSAGHPGHPAPLPCDRVANASICGSIGSSAVKLVIWHLLAHSGPTYPLPLPSTNCGNLSRGPPTAAFQAVSKGVRVGGGGAERVGRRRRR